MVLGGYPLFVYLEPSGNSVHGLGDYITYIYTYKYIYIYIHTHIYICGSFQNSGAPA